MSKTANIYTRVDPKIKEQAEYVLGQLGISMATFMEMSLRQVALQRKIPFEIALPATLPKALGALKGEELEKILEKSMTQYKEGKAVSFKDFEANFRVEHGL